MRRPIAWRHDRNIEINSGLDKSYLSGEKKKEKKKQKEKTPIIAPSRRHSEASNDKVDRLFT